MTDFKKKINKISSNSVSKGVEKSRERKSKPWLKYYSAPIARRILSVLKEKGLPQNKLASALNVQPQQISKIVKGQENLTLETIYKLSLALQFDLLTFPPYKYGGNKNPYFIRQITIDSSSHLVTNKTMEEISKLLYASKDIQSINETTSNQKTITTISGTQFSLV
jgi:transcriptional regulator with XRE-family HTH domain